MYGFAVPPWLEGLLHKGYGYFMGLVQRSVSAQHLCYGELGYAFTPLLGFIGWMCQGLLFLKPYWRQSHQTLSDFAAWRNLNGFGRHMQYGSDLYLP